MANERERVKQFEIGVDDLVARAAAITLAIRQHNAKFPGSSTIPESAIGSIIVADKIEILWGSLDGIDSRLEEHLSKAARMLDHIDDSLRDIRK